MLICGQHRRCQLSPRRCTSAVPLLMIAYLVLGSLMKSFRSCLIVSACTEQCDEEDIPDGQGVRLSAERLAELKEREELAGETGRRAAAQLEACKAEGEALHARAGRNLLTRAADRQEESACRLNAARQKLSDLCRRPEGGQEPGPQSATAAPARTDRPRRPFARPDKR